MYRVLLSSTTDVGLLIPAITCDQDATTGQLGWSDRVQSIDASWNRLHLVRALLSRSMRTCIVMIPFLATIRTFPYIIHHSTFLAATRSTVNTDIICASRYTSPPVSLCSSTHDQPANVHSYRPKRIPIPKLLLSDHTTVIDLRGKWRRSFGGR